MSVCEILPNLWLGNIKCAQNKLFFDTNDIDIVFNCSKDIPFYSNYTKNVRISVNDDLTESEIHRFYFYLSKACDLINENLLDNKNILVHCYAGKQRSAGIIAAYLMKYADMNYNDAIQSIKSKRFIAFTPSVNFEKALRKFENDLLN